MKQAQEKDEEIQRKIAELGDFPAELRHSALSPAGMGRLKKNHGENYMAKLISFVSTLEEPLDGLSTILKKVQNMIAA